MAAYNSSLLVVKVSLVEFYTLFTAKIHYTIPEIYLSRVFNIWELLAEAKTMVNEHCSKWTMTFKAKRWNYDFLTFL